MVDSSEDTNVICEVEFSQGGKRYSYLAEKDAFPVGDYVVVHAGKDNHEATVRIVIIRPRSSEDKTSLSGALKHVLRSANEKEIQTFSKPVKKKAKSKPKKTSKKDNYCGTENSRPYETDGLQADGSFVISYYDAGSDFYGGDVEVIYKLDPDNTRLLKDYLAKKYVGSIESMVSQECGQNCMKKGPTELFEEIGLKYERFVWIS